jgi:catabolite regulation protein CreA
MAFRSERATPRARAYHQVALQEATTVTGLRGAFSAKASIFFKATRIYRLPDKKHNTLVYLAISTKIINGSPANSIRTVPIMPWAN